MRSSKVLSAAVAFALALAGCGSKEAEQQPAQATPNVVQPGAPGEPSKQVPNSTPPQTIGATEVDIKFMQDMIHHHQQALQMTAWAPSRSASPSLELMAKRMELAQQGEIETMEAWLRKHGAEPTHHTGDHQMPGMLTQAQLDRLAAGDGRTFDRLFVRYMTQHHRGALEMVQQLRDAGGGAESEIDSFARDVASDQEIEIGRMQTLLQAP